MDSVGEDDLCWLQLEDFRMLLIKTIEPSRISPYLRQCQVISAEDEEQLFNDPALFIRRRKVGALLDILQRTGVKGYTAFLESLELDYPQVYSRITGKEPNRTFSILVDTAGESGLTQFLMTELSRLQRALQDERRRRQQACSVAKEQEAWSQQQQLRERQLATLTERVQKVQEERERLSDEAKQLRDHNYCLMADINTLTQDKSNALLANRDLQIEVERLKNSLLQAEGQTRLLRRWTLRPLQESLAPPTETFLQPPREEGLKEEQGEGLKEGQGEERKPEEKRGMNLLTTVFRLRREVHRAEEQRATSAEEKEELELSCSELKREARTYRQRIKQTLRQLEEVVRERDKALSSWAEQQAEVRLLLQQKDQYREQVRQLTERSDRLEHCLLRSQGEELQLRTRLRRLTYNNDQWQRSVSSEEEEEPTVNAVKGAGSRDKDLSETSVESEEATAGGTAENRTTASWERQTDAQHLLSTHTHTKRQQGSEINPQFKMKAALVTVALLVLALGWTSEAVQVQENGLSFSLEAVKRLQELTLSRASAGPQNPRLRTSTVSLCADPMLPQEFLPICKQRGASASLSRLAMVPLDVCEICAFAACTGC